MLFIVLRCLRLAAVAVSLVCGTANAQELARQDLELAGLSVYTETARDIYVAGMLLPPDSTLENLLLTPPPKAMEYRLATRRISGRGFAGMLLLQAELGTGSRAPDSATSALSQVKQNMEGSLKQGDHFVIFLNENDETVFLLNDTVMHRVEDGGLFDFFFAGWVGVGASTTFREPILTGQLDKDVVARFKGLSPSAERVALVADWTSKAVAEIAATPEPEKPNAARGAVEPGATAIAAKTETTAAVDTAATDTAGVGIATVDSAAIDTAAVDTAAVDTGAAETAAVDTAAVDTEAVDTAAVHTTALNARAVEVNGVPAERASRFISVFKLPAPEPVPQSDSVVTGTVPTPKPAPVQEVATALPADKAPELDDREYQRQLQVFVSQVMRQVYGRVKYPKRAIKFQREGRVELAARLDDAGELIDITVESSSGHVGLDRAALTAVQRAAPFSGLSAIAKHELASEDGKGYIMSIPVSFRLQ
jgi:TonB family protein